MPVPYIPDKLMLARSPAGGAVSVRTLSSGGETLFKPCPFRGSKPALLILCLPSSRQATDIKNYDFIFADAA